MPDPSTISRPRPRPGVVCAARVQPLYVRRSPIPRAQLLSDIFNEVEEDLRRDRAARLWKKYGYYVLAAAVAIVAATAGWTWWNDHLRRRASAEGDRFFAALAKMDPSQPAPALEQFSTIGRDAKSGYRTVALMHEAGLKARAGDADGALALYRSIAADAGADPDLRDAASLLGASVGIERLPPARSTP